MYSSQINQSLNNLIEINTQLIFDYRLASSKAVNQKMTSFFARKINKSIHFIQKISASIKETKRNEINKYNSKIADGWLKLKAEILNHDIDLIMKSCTISDFTAIDAYQKVLNNEEVKQNKEIYNLLKRQQNQLENATFQKLFAVA